MHAHDEETSTGRSPTSGFAWRPQTGPGGLARCAGTALLDGQEAAERKPNFARHWSWGAATLAITPPWAGRFDLGRFDEVLPIAEQAQRIAHDDFGVYCLYCGLMARQDRGIEVAQLFEFLKRCSVQVQTRSPEDYRNELGEQFEFARSEMNRAGFV